MIVKLVIKLFRDIKQSAGPFFAFVLIIAVGAFFYAGLTTLSDTLSAYTKAYFQEHNIADLHVYYSQISKQELSGLSEIEGIHKLEGRYTFDATQSFADYKASLKVHSIPPNNEINTPAIIEGRIPSKKGEILVDSHYANEHHYRVGDEIHLRANDKHVKFTISGLCENVEYAKKNAIQDHKTYGVAYISEESIPEIAGGFFYNEILIDAKDGSDMNQVGKSI